MSDLRQRGLTIGALAQAAGVTVETIRFYQRRGLLPIPPRAHGAIRHYDEADLARLHFIKAAQRLGFRLDEVAELLRLDGGTGCAEAARIARARLVGVRARLRDLRRIEAVLARVIDACDTGQGQVACPLIAALR